jgi:hypothetical protein
MEFNNKLKYENKKLKKSFYIFSGYLLEQCLGIWQKNSLIFFPNYGYWKSQKAHELSTFNL